MTDRLKGVYVANSNDWLNRQQVKSEIKDKLFELYQSI